MRKPNLIAYALILAILIIAVNGNVMADSVIHGIVYDLSLKRVNNAEVEINTSPRQFIVAQNGSYSFNAPKGDYAIKARLMQKNTVVASVQENVTIKHDGSYALDLILFPDVEEGIEEIDVDIDSGIAESAKSGYIFWIIVSFIALSLAVILIGLLYFKKLKNHHFFGREFFKPIEKDEHGDLCQIIKLIEQEGGRTTQKEVRKQIPLSEAKISLMLAELEHKGVIEKIKKGRGNIIILVKNEKAINKA